MLQIQGAEGEAGVTYREPSTTKEMRGSSAFPKGENMTNCFDA